MDAGSIAALGSAVLDLVERSDALASARRRGRPIPGSMLTDIEAILYLADQARDLAQRLAAVEARLDAMECPDA